MTEQRKLRLKRKIQESRFRLRHRSAEFADPLLDMLFVATKDVTRISTNGRCIYFDPDWLQKLGPRELDFMLAHQLMHIALGHIERPKYYTGDRFHLACDIVSNSNLELLGFAYDKLPGIGTIYHETFFPEYPGRALTAQEAFDCVPFDPATLKPAVRRKYMIDSEEWWDRIQDCGENGIIVLQPGEEDPENFLSDEETRHIGPLRLYKEEFRDRDTDDAEDTPQTNQGPTSSWDKSAVNEISSLRSYAKKEAENGTEDGFVERAWQRVNSGNINWRELLESFLQEEVNDYSFTPPDKRLQDSDFFLPDYNVQVEKPKQVLCMVDSSGSVSDEMLLAVYDEIYGALTQFNGGLTGLLGFFDTQVYAPIYFSDVTDLLNIIPYGGGGTDFNCVFNYIEEHVADYQPVEIVIFTDGKADFPPETAANNTPVLWLFSNKSVVPPWGKYAYIDL